MSTIDCPKPPHRLRHFWHNSPAGPCPTRLTAAFRGQTWTLHKYSPTSAIALNPAIAGKRCPTCGADFSQFSADELTAELWPGGRAQ